MNYQRLLLKHKLHHLFPAEERDPDYTTHSQNFWTWWFSFMRQYITLWQLIIMAVLFNVLLQFFSQKSLLVFWIIPAFLATLQLFYFGTFRPHRLPHLPEMEPHKSRSQSRNHIWAMLSCYFFGYHYEHHESPKTPWWQLWKIKIQ
jgi:beta-carotene ketolase (CrtW type)